MIKNPINNNRNDHALRAAVTSVQSLLHQGEGEAEVYRRVLEHAAKLTESKYSFILSIKLNGMKAPTLSLKEVICLQKERKTLVYAPPEQQDKLTHEQANSYWLNFLDVGLPRVFECLESDELLSAFPISCPKFENGLIVPLTVQKKLLAVICLTNSDLGYGREEITRLRPLWTAFELAMRAARNAAEKSDRQKKLAKHSKDKAENVNNFYAEQFFSICYASLNGIISVDEHFCVSSFNSAAENIFGIKTHEAIGRSLNHFIPNASALTVAEVTSQKGTKIWRGIEALRTDGTSFLLDISVYRSRFGGRDQVTYIFEDISDRIESARLFQENNQRFGAISNLAPVGILQVGTDWSCTYANEKMCELSGLSIEELSEQGWIQAIYDDDAEAIINKLQSTVSQGEPFEQEFRLQTPLGKVTWVQANARALYDELGVIMGLLATITDISAQMKVESQLRELAEFDPLTGLVNRTFFNSRLQQAFNSSSRHGNVVLFFLDLDGFKEINDTLGHDVGDELLKQVAKRITKAVRQEDVVARLGGDEFTVILTHLQDDILATNVAEKIVKQMRAPFNVLDQEIFVTVSIGIAVGNNENSDRNTILKQADIALYRAKKIGRNNFQFFTPEMDAQAKARLFLSNNLHRALDGDEFELFYQPQYGGGVELKIIGFEALLRWQHPKAGKIMPDQFIHLLEETGLICDVGEWVVRNASRQMKQWVDQGIIARDVKMSVNLSARQMHDAKLPIKVCEILNDCGLSAESLILEITETSLVENSELSHSILNELRALGIVISLDDFGTGYSSLSYLKRFPIGQLKIDRSFIADIIDDPDDASIVRAIVAMAKSLHLEIVAEGVDSDDKLQFLRELGCDVYQGHYFAKAESAGDIETRCRNFTNSKEVSAQSTQGKLDDEFASRAHNRLH